MGKKISVALCTYNGEKYVEEQINSILKQTILPDEIIVGDDCSTDRTVEIVNNLLASSNISYTILPIEKNLGVVKNFERTITSTTGEIIFTSDQDDVWVETKIEKIIEKFEEDETTILIFSDAVLVDKNLKNLDMNLWESLDLNISVLKKNEDFLKYLIVKNGITGATLAFKRDLLDKTVPFSKKFIHDYWLGIVAASYGMKIKSISEPLVKYRQHDTNVVGAEKKSFLKKTHLFWSSLNDKEILLDYYNQKERMFADLIHLLDSNRSLVPEKNYREIREAYEFWMRQNNLSNLSKKNRITLIFNNIKNNNYKRYFTGNKAMLRDVLGTIRLK